MNVIGSAHALQAGCKLAAQRAHQGLRIRVGLSDEAIIRRWLSSDVRKARGLLITFVDGERQLPVEAVRRVGTWPLQERSNPGGSKQSLANPLEWRLSVDDTSDQMVRRRVSRRQVCSRSCIMEQIRVGEQPGNLVARQEPLRGEMGQAGDVGAGWTSDQVVRRSASGWKARLCSCIRKHISVGEQPADLVARQDTRWGKMGRADDVGVRLAGLVFRDVIVAGGQSGSQ